MKVKNILLLLIIVITSCKEDHIILEINENSTKFNKFLKEEDVGFSNLIEYKKGSPQEIHVIDTTLLIRNRSKGSDYFLYSYSLTNNRLSKGYIAKGKGPFEAIGASKSGILKDKIWIYDVSSYKVIFLDKKRFILNETDSLYEEFKLKKNNSSEFYFYGSLSFIDNLNFLGVSKWGTPSKSKIEKVNLDSGQEIKNFGKYKEISKINIETIRDAHTSHIFYNYKRQKVALPYRYSDVLEIYDVNESDCKSIQGPENYNVYFTEEKGSYYHMGKTKKTKKTFISGTYTDDFIYLIYSGHLRENRSESDRFKWSTGKFIFVYDWDGNPVKKINLDRRVSTIGVSNNNKTLYSYDLNTGYLIKASIE